jgi:hypothetical protein
VKLRGSLDLAEVQETTVQEWKNFEAQKGRSHRSGSRGAWVLLRESAYREFVT